MLTLTIVLCGHCRSPRPTEVRGAEDLEPGLYEAKMELLHGICIPCSTKTSPKGGVTQGDTGKRNNPDKEER
jgi:hypothetical protein